jgi:hypothetical protein
MDSEEVDVSCAEHACVERLCDEGDALIVIRIYKIKEGMSAAHMPSALLLTWIANMRMHFERAWERSPMIRKAYE